MKRDVSVSAITFALIALSCLLTAPTLSNAQSFSVVEARIVGWLCTDDRSTDQYLNLDAQLVDATHERIGSQDPSKRLLYPDDVSAIAEKIKENALGFYSFADCFRRVFAALEPRQRRRSEPFGEPNSRRNDARMADLVLPDPVAIELAGYEFSIKEDDFRGLIRSSRIFTVEGITERYVFYRFSDIESGKELSGRARKNSLIQINSECRLRVYSINTDAEVAFASFQLYCDS